jgi:Reverse transcriptase (RNA-dependent DNA polymerase)
VGAIYGPNNNDPVFFDNLERDLITISDAGRTPIIIGGDWNATWDVRDSRHNIDVINMASIPSKYRTGKIKSLAEALKLTDPFRYFKPLVKEFTYIPNARENINRSRIDFFLVTESLIDTIHTCEIEPAPRTTSFDHKSVCIMLGKKNKPVNRDNIKNQLINDPIVRATVAATVLEAHLQNADSNSFPSYEKNRYLLELGRIFNRIEDFNANKLIRLSNGNDIGNDQQLMVEIDEIFETLPDLEFFENIDKSCSADIFFESLLLSVKNSVLSQQHKIYKVKNAKKNLLLKRLNELKKNRDNNELLVQNLEREYSSFLESELRSEIENIKIFDRLNSEKITPFFMNMAKSSQTASSLTNIRDGTGAEFATDTGRSEYITGFYASLYDDPDPDKNIAPIDIENFLGEVADSNEVKNAKLTNFEKVRLDRDLHISELDAAINQSNMKSAPGLDGFNNRFIKSHWKFFRVPLLNYTKCCIEKGTLTQNFKTAKIRLIPKKGDISKIGNWRPISLLGCFYKVLSRAYTNRLRPVMDKITAIGQKGYSKTKYCQEVIMSIIEGINKCNVNKKKGALISLDIRKAFDSISHKYLESCLKFFNFGDQFIKVVMLLCTGRQAAIILDDNKIGKNFDLLRGNAQGDTISPFLFNIGYQILLLKINGTLQIESILDIPALPASHSPIPPSVSKKPRKVFAFADDCNIITSLQRSNLDNLKKILDDFKLLSGLECNVEKSHLMPIGNVTEIENDIKDSGFDIKREINVLGIKIKGRDGSCINTEKEIQNKVRNQISFWSRFNLSLPGRIDIAKTMLYSQLNYTGCFLPMSNDFLKDVETQITDFVKGKLKMAEKRLFEKVEHGGLGLFRVKIFLDSQKCSWIRRALNLDEIWKMELFAKSPGNIYRVKPEFMLGDVSPQLLSLAECIENLMVGHSKTNSNFKKGYIFNNSAYTVGLRGPKLDENSWGNTYDHANKMMYYNLTFNNVFNELGDIKVEIYQNFHFTARDEIAKKLKKLYATAVTRYGNNPKNSESFEELIARVKKGSKTFRNILTDTPPYQLTHNLVKFSDNTETIINVDTGKILNAVWKFSYLSNACRTFCFKFYNNILPYNHVLSHFVRGQSRNCTFCDLSGNQEEEDETPLHLFYNCSVSENIRNTFFNEFLGVFITRQEFFTIPTRENQHSNRILFVVTTLFRKFLWDCKLNGILPEYVFLKNYILGELKLLARLKPLFLLHLQQCDLKNEFKDSLLNYNF